MANAALDVFFTKDLNLVNTGREAYNSVIVFLRERLKGDRYFHDHPNSPLARTWCSHNLPVLRPQLKVKDPKLEAKEVPWFELVVRTPQNRVTFKLRRDNLFVVGYQVHRTTGDDQWREFRRKDEDGNINPIPLIPGSNFLPFGGDYLDMERYGRISLGRTSIGQQDLIRAVDNLVPTTTTDPVRAQSLIVVIFMISESTRFRHVSDFIATNYPKSVQIDSEKVYCLTQLVKVWDNLSSALLRVDAGEKFYTDAEPLYTLIKKKQEAVEALGILKYTSYRKNSNAATSTSTLPVPFSTA